MSWLNNIKAFFKPTEPLVNPEQLTKTTYSVSLPDGPPVCGIALLKQVEGCKLVGYPDDRGIPTDGYGNTHGAVIGKAITQEQADADLIKNCAWAWDAIKKCVHVPLTSFQAGALLSFVYNEGATAFQNSTLLELINAGKFPFVPQELRKWNKEKRNGEYVIDKGLVNRREQEISLWTNNDWRPT